MRASTPRAAHQGMLCLTIIVAMAAGGIGCGSGSDGVPGGAVDTGPGTEDIAEADVTGDEVPEPPSDCAPEETWCPAGPWGTPDRFTALLAFAEDDLWLAGWTRPLLRWDGETLSALADVAGATHLNGIWGTDPSNVWVCGHGFVAHWDGDTWTEHETGFDGSLAGIWGSADGDVWAVGHNGTIIRFDGAAWTQTAMDENPQVAEYLSPQGIWGTAADDIWVVGNTGGASSPGFVYRWDGASWSRVQVPPAEGTAGGFGSVWGSGPDDIWVTGPGETDVGRERDGPTPTLHWDGAAWSVVAPGLDGRFSSVHGSGPDDVWLSGEGGAAHWDGQAWTIEEIPFGTGPVAAWAPDRAWMAGRDGALYEWDGSTWGLSVRPVPDVLAVGGTEDVIWLAGTYGTIAATTGDGWTVEQPGPGVDLQAVWIDGDGLPWVAGAGGTVLRQTPDGWEELGPGGEETLYGIWGSGIEDVWVVGGTAPRKQSASDPGEGVVLRWTGTAWEPADTPLAVTGFAVTGTGPDDVWIAGAQPDPIHWDGTTWSTVPLPGEAIPVNSFLRDVAVDPSGRVWVSGNSMDPDVEYWTGIIAWLEDGQWSVFETGRTNDVAGIWSDGVLAVGAGEGTEIWTGTGDTFGLEEVGEKCFNDVFGQPDGTVWVVGDEGAVFRGSL